MAELIPSYVDMNFDTIKQDIKDKMDLSPVFQDYKNDASNITILIELMSYLGELNTYYINKLAKNVYIDTADLRENIVRLGYLVGYYPKGYRSSRTTLNISIPAAAPLAEGGCNIGDTIQINAWKEVNTDNNTTYNSEVIPFTATNDVFQVVDSFPVSLTVPISQGSVRTYQFHGRDLIDNNLYLPSLDFGYDDNLDDDYPSVEVRVNGSSWYRVNDFYEDLSGLENQDHVYVLRYNKYAQYVVGFSSVRSVPTTNDVIDITMLETIGANGNVAANTISSVKSNDFITVTPSAGPEYALDRSFYTINNFNASTGAMDAETNEEMKDSIQGMANAQFRCVTKSDYISFLETHNDVKRAIAWGEKDSSLGGNILEYNKVYITILPNSWENMNYIVNNDNIHIVTSYKTDFVAEISQFLEPRKMLCAYEEFMMPDLAYFRFNISIKIKRNFRYANVREDVRNKLIYYFSTDNRKFGETISFMDITNFILDTNITSATDTFPNIKGIYYLTIRDIDRYDLDTVSWMDPYPFGDTRYPQWNEVNSPGWEENVLKDALLYFNQYPMVSIENCTFTQDF